MSHYRDQQVPMTTQICVVDKSALQGQLGTDGSVLPRKISGRGLLINKKSGHLSGGIDKREDRG